MVVLVKATRTVIDGTQGSVKDGCNPTNWDARREDLVQQKDMKLNHR